MKTAIIMLFFYCFIFSAGNLTMTQTSNEITVTSTAGKTWKVVFCVARNASSSTPGGGTARALYIPANSSKSIVSTSPHNWFGLDNMEWRMSPGGRSDIGRNATINSLDVIENTPTRIVFRMAGSWPNVSSFTRTTTVDPYGYTTELNATWNGQEEVYSMWWLFTHIRSDYVDGDNVKIHDHRGGPDFDLPYAKEGIFRLPWPVKIPYLVKWPVRGTRDTLYQDIHLFDDKTVWGENYEFWPAAGGYYLFFPRWVTSGGFQRRMYPFKWQWRFVPGSSVSVNQSAHNKDIQAGKIFYRIIPNPLNKKADIQFLSGHVPEAISLYDIKGNLVRQVRSGQGSCFTIHRGSLANGIYIVNFRSRGKRYSQKIVLK